MWGERPMELLSAVPGCSLLSNEKKFWVGANDRWSRFPQFPNIHYFLMKKMWGERLTELCFAFDTSCKPYEKMFKKFVGGGIFLLSYNQNINP